MSRALPKAARLIIHLMSLRDGCVCCSVKELLTSLFSTNWILKKLPEEKLSMQSILNFFNAGLEDMANLHSMIKSNSKFAFLLK